MGKFLKASFVFTLVTASFANKVFGGRQQSFTRGIVLADSLQGHHGHRGPPVEPENDIIVQASPIPHQDQAFVVSGGYKVADGVLDGSFGGVTHGANGIRYGYDHEGPHHHQAKEAPHPVAYSSQPYQLEFKEETSAPLHTKDFEIALAQPNYQGSAGSGSGALGAGPFHHQQNEHGFSISHGNMYHFQHHGPSSSPSSHSRRQPHRFNFTPVEYSPAPHPMMMGGPPPYRHYRHSMPPPRRPGPPPHFLRRHHTSGFRGYGNYGPAYSHGLSHVAHSTPLGHGSTSHSGYGYFG